MTEIMNDINDHKRVNDILLGPLERPALKWLAAKAPAWVTPDICTLVGVFGVVFILIGYVLSNLNSGFLWLASLGFVINWLGDSLDGTLARYRKIERPKYGFYIDHIVDAGSEVLIFLGLGLTPHVSFIVASLTLIAYLLLSVYVYVRTCVMGEFKISYGKLGPTEIRVLAILLNISMFFGGDLSFTLNLGGLGKLTTNPYDLFVTFIGLLLLYFFSFNAAKDAVTLAKENK
ncbi:MAG TPA: CDP-alcohol phosphatidyltransferase family protein [Anaerolineales bacterium]